MNFDNIVSRKGTYTEKYDSRVEKFGTEDVMPLWVADMDLPSSEAIQETLLKRVKHPIYGYTGYYDAYFDAIIHWMEKQHTWSIQQAWITPINAIVTGLNLAVAALSDEGDGVMIQPPIYPPFYTAVTKQKRMLLENELKLVNGHYEIDFEDFEQKAKQAKLFLLCSPHNPTGRVWQREELLKIAQICAQNDVLIISDEVHADLVYAPYQHVPIASLPEARDITITLNAPSKTFNVAGIVSAYAIVENSSLRRRFYEIFRRYSLIQPTPISLATTVAAYRESHEWLDALVPYLKKNLDYLYFRLEKMPKIKAMPMESTFLLWLDCRELKLEDETLFIWFVEKAKLGLNSGASFGNGGSGFMRLNYAVSQDILIIAIDQLEKAYESTYKT
ncbi:MAG: PatB family C-S lyase [Epsilonproteobacteria bacterium]|nr:PatB family C-S lyase [Campylobacterota bacterium]